MIEIRGLERVIGLLGTLPRRIQAELVQEFDAATEEVRASAVKDAPSNIGRLRNAIVINKEKAGMSQTVSVQTDYGAVMEWGSKKKVRVPGVLTAYAAQFKGAKIGTGDGKLREAIEKWVKRKGIGAKRTKGGKISKSKDSQRAQKQAAFLIARSIYTKGVTPHPFFFKHVFRVRKKLEQRLNKIIDNA